MISGDNKTLKIGALAAHYTLAIGLIYIPVLLIGGVVRGLPAEPYFAIAEVLTMISAVVLVLLMTAIHRCTPEENKLFSLLGLGWMFVAAAITITVHSVELTVARQLDEPSRKAFARLLDFEWPSMLYAIEFVSWHIGLGLSTIFAAFAFDFSGAERPIRIGFLLTGLLCLAGITGPATGVMVWRLIGVLGYVLVLPLTCIPLAALFKKRML